MRRTALVPLAEGFEEIEAVTIIDVLRRAGVDVTVAALRGHPVEGAHGIDVAADVTLEEVHTRRYDAVVLPGGMPGAANLRDDPRVREVLIACVRHGGTAAAICAAPIVLEAAGLLEGRRVTAYPGFREELATASARVSDRVVSDGPIVTSSGPGTALEFALTLAERLVSRDAAAKLRTAMLV